MEGVQMETYREAKLCQRCMQTRRGFKSIAASKHKQVLLSYMCATVSIVISLSAFWLCYRLHSKDVMKEDITHLHSLIKELTSELDVLKSNQMKINTLQNNQNKMGGNIVHVSEDYNATYKSANNRHEGKEASAPEILQINQSESSSFKYYEQEKEHRIVKRSRKGRGKKKSGLPFIQIEGSGTQVHQTDKNAVTGYWTLPGWLAKNKRVKAAKKFFKFGNLNKSGKLRLKKSGVYLIYAQFTLVGNQITGFHVSLEHSSSNTEKILQCTQFVKSKTSDDSQATQSCFTMGIVELKKDQEIFIQESANNSGANYSNVSYFGLVRIGD